MPLTPDEILSCLRAHRSGGDWRVTGSALSLENYVLEVGRLGHTQWTGYGPPALMPEVLIAGDVSYARRSAALEALGSRMSLDELESRLNGRWLRLPTEELLRNYPTGAASASLELWMVWERPLHPSDIVFRDELRFEIPAHQIRGHVEEDAVVLDRVGGTEIRFHRRAPQDAPREPAPQDCVDRSSLLRAKARPPVLHRTVDMFEVEPDGKHPWTVSFQRDAGAADCTAAGIRALLRRKSWRLVRGLEIDSEASTVVVRCRTRGQAEAVAQTLSDLATASS